MNQTSPPTPLCYGLPCAMVFALFSSLLFFAHFLVIVMFSPSLYIKQFFCAWHPDSTFLDPFTYVAGTGKGFASFPSPLG